MHCGFQGIRMEDNEPVVPTQAVSDGPAEGNAIVLPPVATPAREYRFEFSGDAKEYFRIWIVNLALSILTLGVFSAWAKVRTQRYFYSNTRLADVPFEYLAQPLPILKGRAIAFTLFGSYVLAGQFSVQLQLVLLALIGLLAPWLIVRGLMFHARYSSWRGLTFRFLPRYGQAYRWYFFAYILIPLSLGLAFPYVKFRQKKFVIEQHRFGGREFKFLAGSGDFYPPYIISIALVVGWIVVASIVFGMAVVGHGIPPAWSQMVLAGFVYFGYFLAWVYVYSRITNLTYNEAELDGYRLRSTLGAFELVKLYLLNTVAILLTLGMAIPWAAIRMAHYRAAHLELVAPGDLDSFTAEWQRDESALGAEMDNLFDLDIGL
jgi:uncharacterized membrane protein YjgN (DUF898 family)